MGSLTAVAIVAGVSIGLFAIWYLARAARAWRRFRGSRVVTCPETGYPAAVRIDAVHAAMTATGAAGVDVRLAGCSRWKTRGRCDEACLEEAVDPGSMVSAIASNWYAGKRCVYCGGPLHDEPFVDHHSAILDPDGTTREWSDLPADRLPAALSTGSPVCWNCHIAETFRRQYPALVTDRTNSTRGGRRARTP